MLWRELAIVLCNFVALQITVDEALAKLRAVRPWVCPNDGFVVRGPQDCFTPLCTTVRTRTQPAHTAGCQLQCSKTHATPAGYASPLPR